MNNRRQSINIFKTKPSLVARKSIYLHSNILLKNCEISTFVVGRTQLGAIVMYPIPFWVQPTLRNTQPVSILDSITNFHFKIAYTFNLLDCMSWFDYV